MEPVNDNVRVLGNRYEIGDLLGRGGMAEVHAGRDTRLGRTVAVKLLRTDLARDATFQARFRREAQSAAALNHPAIVAVYDTGEESMVEASGGVVNLPYIVMEHVEGRTLREVLGEGHHLDVDAALEITTGVLAALEYSHRIGIVHRDIKPANVMLTPVGDVKVMDFGIARAMADSSSTMTQTQAVIGTAQYLSPEQARGEQVDTRSDLYSAGCLLYELLTGRPPFMGDSPVSVAYQHVREQPIPPSHVVGGIPEAVDRIVLHSLAKGRDERYQTATDFRADVEAARGGRQIYAPMPAMTGSNATTQYMPPADGTRAMPPVPNAAAQGAAMYGDQATTVGGPGAYDQYDQNPYDPFSQQDDYSRRSRQPEPDNRRPLIIGAVVLAVIVVLALILSQTVFKGAGSGDTGSTGTGTAVTIPEDIVGMRQSVAVKALTDQGNGGRPGGRVGHRHHRHGDPDGRQGREHLDRSGPERFDGRRGCQPAGRGEPDPGIVVRGLRKQLDHRGYRDQQRPERGHQSRAEQLGEHCRHLEERDCPGGRGYDLRAGQESAGGPRSLGRP